MGHLNFMVFNKRDLTPKGREREREREKEQEICALPLLRVVDVTIHSNENKFLSRKCLKEKPYFMVIWLLQTSDKILSIKKPL